MWRLTVGGLGLIAAASAFLIGSIVDAPIREIAWTNGAWLAVAAVAVAYRVLCGTRSRTLPAAAFALLAIAASALTVETTIWLKLARDSGGVPEGWGSALAAASPVPVLLLAVAASGSGLALLARVAWLAGLAKPGVGATLTTSAIAGALIAHPAAPYLLVAGPLGLVLVSSAVRTRRRTRPASTPPPAHRPEPPRVARAVDRICVAGVAGLNWEGNVT
jgi:hypothetical protein